MSRSRGTSQLVFQHADRHAFLTGEEAAFAAVQEGRIQSGDVLVIRYEGPRGGPGMREMLGVTAALVELQVSARDSVALLTDRPLPSGATLAVDSWPGHRRCARSGEWRSWIAALRVRGDVAIPGIFRRGTDASCASGTF